MIKANVFVILCLCFSLAWGISEEMQELIDMLHNNCKAETGVEEEAIKQAQSRNIDMTNEKLKCYAFCLMSEMSTISEDGVVDPEAVLAVMPEDLKPLVGPNIIGCGSPSGASPCENALLAFKCYCDRDPAHFFFP